MLKTTAVKSTGVGVTKNYLALPRRILPCTQTLIQSVFCSVLKMTKAVTKKKPCMMRKLQGYNPEVGEREREKEKETDLEAHKSQTILFLFIKIFIYLKGREPFHPCLNSSNG